MLQVYEYGQPRLIGMSPVPVTYTSGDVLKVAIEYDAGLKKNVVRWYRNTTVLYTSSSPSITYPLVVDSSIYSPGSWLHQAHLCPPPGGGAEVKPGAGSGAGGGGGTAKASPTRTRTLASTPSPSPSPTSSKPSGKRTDPQNPQGPNGVNVVDTLIYLHSDHLGSVSVATGANQQLVSQQEYDPWGKVRSGGVTQTKINYTGQKLDGTGLLYYHARMYDPGLGRFVSADSIVPGASSGAGGAGGTVGAWQDSSLTVDFHENDFFSSINGENGLILEEGFSFQQKSGKAQSGPSNPQALNRYSYVLGNPLRYIDPTGHGHCTSLCDAHDRGPHATDGGCSGMIVLGDCIPGSYAGSGTEGFSSSAVPPPAGQRPGGNPQSPKGVIVPQEAYDTVSYAKAKNGAARPGYKGGRPYENDGRDNSQILPTHDAKGNPITYREYDVDPHQKGVTNRGNERVVIGSDGRTYYTNDHYQTFTEFK